MFVSNTMYKLMKQSGEWFNARIASEMNGILNREIQVFEGMPLIKVPSARFCNNFDFSATDGFSKATGSKDLNFVICDRNAVQAVVKYQKPKIVAPEYNTDGDFYVYGYRINHDLFSPTNKQAFVYIHAKSTTN